MKNLYRKVNHDLKVFEHLYKLEKNSETFQTWQPENIYKNYGRNFLELGIEQIFTKKRLILTSVLHGGIIGDQEVNELFCRGFENEWAYKSFIKGNTSGKIILTIPQEILLLEKRLHSRFKIPREKFSEIILSVEHLGRENFYKFQMEDISCGGMKLLIPNESRNMFMRQDQPIKVHSIAGIRTKNEAFVARKPLYDKFRQSKISQLGLMLTSPLDNRFLDYFEREFRI